MTIIELLNKIKKEGFANIVDFAQMDENGNFIDFEYFTIDKKGVLFYIQNNKYTGFDITPYKRIDYNHKQQLSYTFIFNSNFREFKKFINALTKELQNKNVLPDTYKQVIFFDLLTYTNINNKKITLFNYLKEIAGNREKEILNDLYKIEMKLNNKNYRVLELYNKNNQSFAINIKNINRLIIN